MSDDYERGYQDARFDGYDVGYDVLHGDVTEKLQEVPDNTFDALLSDPPYSLNFMGLDWDKAIPGVDVWGEVLRVLKPGAFGLVFGGTRTFHRLAVAMEDAGFELRDTLMWVYGSGFPKSHDVSKAIDKLAGAEREVVGRGRGRTGALAQPNGGSVHSDDNYQWPGDYDITAPATPDAQRWEGYGTALKPAWEPVLLVRKPTKLTYAKNVLEHGTGALNIDGTRVPAESTDAFGRWPANLIHDDSDGVVGLFPQTNQSSAARFFYAAKASQSERKAGLDERCKHPTMKPIALTEYLAKLLLPPTDDAHLLVPFSGSGSGLIGAARAGWPQATGIDFSEEWVATSMKRLAHFAGGGGA